MLHSGKLWPFWKILDYPETLLRHTNTLAYFGLASVGKKKVVELKGDVTALVSLF